MGGGLPNSKVLFDKFAGSKSVDDRITDLDLSRYKCIHGCADVNAGATFKIYYNQLVDGAKAYINGTYSYIYFFKQSNGLWTIDAKKDNSFIPYVVIGVGDNPNINTTEVQTMTVASDQPISTSNLKAAMQAAEMKWGGVSQKLGCCSAD